MILVLMIAYPLFLAIIGLFLLVFGVYGFKEKQIIYHHSKSTILPPLLPLNTMQAHSEIEKSLNTNYKLSLNREIIRVDDEPKLSLSLVFEYQIKDEKLFHDMQVDQFMHYTIIEVTQKFIKNFGTKNIFDQKIALETRIKGALLANTVEWGIEVKGLHVLKVQSIPLS